MKNLTIGILFLAAAVFGGLYVHQARKANQVQASANTLQQNVNELQSVVAEQEQQATRLREQLEQTRADVAVKNQEAATLQNQIQSAATNLQARLAAKSASQTNSKAANPFSAIFKNPEMKNAIKTSQQAVLGPMIDKNYSRLFSDLHLTSEQAATLKDMLLNKQMGAAEMSMSMLSNEGETNRAALLERVKQSNDAADAQIKDFLGDDNYAQFQAYEKTMGERMAVSGLKDKLAGGATPLTDVQEQQLIQAMGEQRQNYKFTSDLSDKSKFNGDFTSMFTEEKMNTYFQELDKLNQQYQARAAGILSADQLTAFKDYLGGQQAMQKAGMQMAVKIFAPAKSEGE